MSAFSSIDGQQQSSINAETADSSGDGPGNGLGNGANVYVPGDGTDDNARNGGTGIGRDEDGLTDDGRDDLPAHDPLRERIAQAVRAVHDTTPLAQSFTNFVTINLVANAQLAAGGTAAMSYLPDDIADTARICRASYINVGTLLPFYRDALDDIARAFHAAGHRWVLDPVAAGIGATRTRILESFKTNPPTIVRANASEVLALYGIWGLDADAASTPFARPAGVESVDDVDSAAGAARRLARFLAASAPGHQAAVAVSGETDLVTDGEHTYRLPGGSVLMTKITGAGCSMGGVTATYLAVADPLIAALSASLLYDRAAETAESASHGPGSFQSAFLDALWTTSAEQVGSSPILVESESASGRRAARDDRFDGPQTTIRAIRTAPTVPLYEIRDDHRAAASSAGHGRQPVQTDGSHPSPSAHDGTHDKAHDRTMNSRSIK